MHTNTRKIMKVMEQIAPSYLKEDWDNVGLMVGNQNKMVQNILLALEVSEEVIEEAINQNADMIITHHPLIYKPLEKIVDTDPISKMIIKLIKNDINLFVAHTNLDAAHNGTSQYVAELMNLSNINLLKKEYTTQYYKIQIGVPTEHAKKIREAITKAGAGNIGDYSECTFTCFGAGTFKPGTNSNPFIGRKNELETVDEVNIESIVEKKDLDNVISELLKAHPYEVPAYNIIKLENDIESFGVGRVGFLDSKMNLKELAEEAKKILKSDFVKVIGDLDKKIFRVSVITGAGSDYLKVASKKSDVLITGDIKYHEAQLAKQLGLAIIDIGHYETENIYMTKLKEILDLEFEKKSYDVKVKISEIDINPFNVL